MTGFPTWIMATLIAAASVWMTAQINTRYAWYLAVLLILGVLIMRPAGIAQLDAFISDITNQPNAPVGPVSPVGGNTRS
jgi:hypothetical protein